MVRLENWSPRSGDPLQSNLRFRPPLVPIFKAFQFFSKSFIDFYSFVGSLFTSRISWPQLINVYIILRIHWKEGYCQAELDKLFSAIVLPKLMYGMSVYSSSPPELLTYNVSWGSFLESPGNFSGRKAIFRSSVSKDGEVYRGILVYKICLI